MRKYVKSSDIDQEKDQSVRIGRELDPEEWHVDQDLKAVDHGPDLMNRANQEQINEKV